MKRILFALAMVFIFGSAFGQMNPNWEYYRTMRWKAKPGQAENFKKAAAKKTQMFNNTPETAMVTYQIMTGPDQGKFERVYANKTLAQLYSENPQEFEYWSKNVAEFTEEPSGAKVWWRIKGWSVNWDPAINTPSKYMEVQTLVIKDGHGTDFRRAMNRRMSIMKENSTRQMAVFKLSSGGQSMEFRIITFFDDPMKAMGEWKSEDFNYEDAYNEKYGYDARDTDWAAFTKAIEIYGNMIETHKLVPEASFMGN